MRTLAILLLLWMVAAPAWATMYIVDGSGAAPVVGVDYYGNTAKNSTHQTIVTGMAAATVSGDTVFVRDGTYAEQITNARWKTTNVVLVGQSKSAIIQYGSASDYAFYGPGSAGLAGAKVLNFTIQSGGVAGSRFLRLDSPTDDFTFEDCVVRDFATILYEPASAGTKSNINFVDCSFQELLTGPVLGYYIYVEAYANDYNFTRCTFDFDDVAKVTSAPDILIAGAFDVRFEDCNFYPNEDATYVVQVAGDPVITQTASKIEFVGGQIHEMPSGMTKALFFGGSTVDDCVDSVLVTAMTINGSPSPAGTQYLVEIENVYDAAEVFSEHFEISDNYLTGGTVGIVIAEGGLRGSVTGNRIVSPSAHGLLVQDSRHVTFANNWVSGSAIGFETDGGGARAENSYAVNVIGNIFQDCAIGLNKDVATAVQDTAFVYSGNVFVNCTDLVQINSVAKTLAEWKTYQPVGGPAAGIGAIEYPGGSYDGAVRKSAAAIPFGFHRKFGNRGPR